MRIQFGFWLICKIFKRMVGERLRNIWLKVDKVYFYLKVSFAIIAVVCVQPGVRALHTKSDSRLHTNSGDTSWNNRRKWCLLAQEDVSHSRWGLCSPFLPSLTTVCRKVYFWGRSHLTLLTDCSLSCLYLDITLCPCFSFSSVWLNL